MFQRLLNTQSLTGGQWLTVLGLSLVMPLAVGVDKAIQLRRQRTMPAVGLPAVPAVPAPRA
jgi:Ca2+-transporting ATPase